MSSFPPTAELPGQPEMTLASLVRIMSRTPPEVQVEQKAMICCALNGYDHEGWQKMSQYGPMTAAMYKPQYIHSATAVFLCLRHPRIVEGEGSFVDYIVKEGIEQEALTLAISVLRRDSQAFSYTQELDAKLKAGSAFEGGFVVDERNKTVKVL